VIRQIVKEFGSQLRYDHLLTAVHSSAAKDFFTVIAKTNIQTSKHNLWVIKLLFPELFKDIRLRSKSIMRIMKHNQYHVDG